VRFQKRMGPPSRNFPLRPGQIHTRVNPYSVLRQYPSERA
jgi:hypothetical protein